MKFSTTILITLFFYFGALTFAESIDISFCRNFHEVQDFDGNYAKTICFVDTSKNYTEAFDFCESKGMKLFDLKDSSSLIAWMEFSRHFWNPESGPYFWVHISTKKCMKLIKPANKPYKIVENSCAQFMHFICEYNRVSPFQSSNYLQESEVEKGN